MEKIDWMDKIHWKNNKNNIDTIYTIERVAGIERIDRINRQKGRQREDTGRQTGRHTDRLLIIGPLVDRHMDTQVGG